MWEAGFYHERDERPATEEEVKACCLLLGWTLVEGTDSEGMWHVEVTEEGNKILEGGGDVMYDIGNVHVEINTP